MGIVRFALRWPYTFFVVALLILFLGVTACRSMPSDIFPQIDIPVVTVIWQETGLSTPEMEQRVTTYSQYAISSNVSGIKDIEAQTLTGISVQKIYFQPDVNLDLGEDGEPVGYDIQHASRHADAIVEALAYLQRRFAVEAHRQSGAVAASAHAKEDQDSVDGISDSTGAASTAG